MGLPASIQALFILCRTDSSLLIVLFMLQREYALSMVTVVAVKTTDTVSKHFSEFGS
jgi:hypothetical protein